MIRARLFQLNLSVDDRFGGAPMSAELRRTEYGVAIHGHAVGLLDRPQARGDPRLAGGDGVAVATAVRAFGQGLAVALYLTDVGFALRGLRFDGEHDGVGCGRVEGKADRL